MWVREALRLVKCLCERAARRSDTGLSAKGEKSELSRDHKSVGTTALQLTRPSASERRAGAIDEYKVVGRVRVQQRGCEDWVHICIVAIPSTAT